ncbi:hypothetical protein A1O1_05491 [Capronia coronata CBS 617.96]|uniref:Uncharacterized protein n=1 Tax=Capronia coronata CBS 617.96 TaxID=1182541 RepID=W9YH20_9EURO|nr:uncharacterized protein A1O1_05491 [Capronia coronata CBS 617.96]EXJ88561.1 hypothetical protein A1O1_05491 [Capronia coronata CBS 617.96]
MTALETEPEETLIPDNFSDFSNPDLIEASLDPPVLQRKLIAIPTYQTRSGYSDTEDDLRRLPTKPVIIAVIAAAALLLAVRPQLFSDTVLCLLLFVPYPDFARHSRWCIVLPLLIYDSTQGKLESAVLLSLLATTTFIDWSYAWGVVNRGGG